MKKKKTTYVVEVAIGWGESSMTGPFESYNAAQKYVKKHGSGTIHEVVYPDEQH